MIDTQKGGGNDLDNGGYVSRKGRFATGATRRVLHIVVRKLIDASIARRKTEFMDDAEKRDTIENVTARIIAWHPDAQRTVVARAVAEEYDQLASSRIRTYIPTLIGHGAWKRINREFAPGP